MSSVVTRSGSLLDLANPDPAGINRDDIAAGLSGACRFAAQTEVFYSVAQHAVMVADLVEAFLDDEGDSKAPRAAALLAVLHHDSHEAFMGDLPAPLKMILPEYERIAARVDEAIFEAMGLGPSVLTTRLRLLVKRADIVARCVEAEEVIPKAADLVVDSVKNVADEDLTLGRQLWRSPLVPAEARALFTEREDNYHQILQYEVEGFGGVRKALQLPEFLGVTGVPLAWFIEE